MSETGAERTSDELVHFDRLRFLTENYTQLQGLRLIPIGLMFVGLGLFWNPGVSKLTLSVIVAVALAGVVLIGRYYSRRFGRVRRRWSSHLRDGVVVGLFLAAFFGGVWLDRHLVVPVSVSSLAVAGLFYYIHGCSGGHRRHYAVLAWCFVVLGLVPLSGLIESSRIFAGGSLGFWIMGAAYLLIGTLDHLLLVRSLGPAQAGEDDEDAL